jgi:hypothetical protein
LAKATAELRLQDGTLTADADVLLADIPGPVAGATELEELGWRVYPD